MIDSIMHRTFYADGLPGPDCRGPDCRCGPAADIDTGYGHEPYLISGLLSAVLVQLCFVYFFQVEKHTLAAVPNSQRSARVTTSDGSTYDSLLPCAINIVDASWFTTIIREDPFLVSGHFRQQPYGPGRGQYKLIYIAPFQKNGYRREAKMGKSTSVHADFLPPEPVRRCGGTAETNQP